MYYTVMDITQYGDMRVKLTKLKFNRKSVCNKHQSKESH